MTVLPRISGQEVVRAFERIGYCVDHQTGSHIILRQQAVPHGDSPSLITRRSEKVRYWQLFAKPDSPSANALI